jgi:hypothetical protein
MALIDAHVAVDQAIAEGVGLGRRPGHGRLHESIGRRLGGVVAGGLGDGDGVGQVDRRGRAEVGRGEGRVDRAGQGPAPGQGVDQGRLTPAPSPVITATGRAVAWVRSTDVGWPRLGVTRVGLVASTIAPAPVTGWVRAASTPVPSPAMAVIG